MICLKIILILWYLVLWQKKNKNKNNKLVNVVKSGLSDLKDKIKETSEDEKEMEKPDKILKIVA